MTRKSRREIEELVEHLEPETAGSGPVQGLSGDALDMAVDTMMDAMEDLRPEKQARVEELLDRAIEHMDQDDGIPEDTWPQLGRILFRA